jgi:hypothetical protein
VEAGEAAGGVVWPAAGAGKGAALEVGDGADGWAPSVGERERGGREGRGFWGRVGRKYMGRRDWVGFVVSFFFFFFFFKSIFPSIFKSNLFHILTRIYPTILRLLENL